jgi:hypothetical protein
MVDAGVSGAAAQPALGNVACNVTGTGKFAPKLTLTGVATTTVKFKFKEVSPTSGGCTGSVSVPNSAGSLSPVTVHGVTVKGVGSLKPTGPGNANACSVFTGSDTIGTIVVKYVWSATPAIAPSVVTYTNGVTPIVSGTPFDTIALQAAGATVTGTGSFAPPAAAPNTMLTNIAATCGAGWGPYPGFTIGLGSTIALP